MKGSGGELASVESRLLDVPVAIGALIALLDQNENGIDLQARLSQAWSTMQDGFGGLRYLPIQKVEKMRLRMSSAVVAPVMASMGRRAA